MRPLARHGGRARAHPEGPFPAGHVARREGGIVGKLDFFTHAYLIVGLIAHKIGLRSLEGAQPVELDGEAIARRRKVVDHQSVSHALHHIQRGQEVLVARIVAARVHFDLLKIFG